MPRAQVMHPATDSAVDRLTLQSACARTAVSATGDEAGPHALGNYAYNGCNPFFDAED